MLVRYCACVLGNQERLQQLLTSWSDYSEQLDACDDFLEQSVSPWVRETPAPTSLYDAETQLTEAKVILVLWDLFSVALMTREQ